MTTNHLLIDGNAARDTYLLEALKLIQRYGVVRAHTLALGLFFNRAKSAALAAAQRVLANGIKEGLLTSVDDPRTRRRYYALTLKGGRFLNAVDPDYPTTATQPLLKKLSRANHREWGVLLALASNAREGLLGFAEDQLWSTLRKETLEYFGHVPDAMTLFTSGTSQHVAVWHEVEASRRSRTPSIAERAKAKAEGRVARSGMDNLKHLLDALRTKRYVTFKGREHIAVLVLHCATAKIEREIRATIESAFTLSNIRRDESSYAIPFASRGYGALLVLINRLPESQDSTWIDTPGLPWPGAPAELRETPTQQFLANPYPPARN